MRVTLYRESEVRVLLHLAEVEIQFSTVPPCQHILQTISKSINQSINQMELCRQCTVKAAAPAKEALHVLEEGVCPLPGGQALLPLVPAAHCAAADQVSIRKCLSDICEN